MREEEVLAVLWDIAREVASKDDPTFDTGMGDVECIFCTGDNYGSEEGFNHTDDCIVTKARALIEEAKQKQE